MLAHILWFAAGIVVGCIITLWLLARALESVAHV